MRYVRREALLLRHVSPLLQVMKDMAVAWVLTLPAAGVIAYILAKMAAFTLPVVAYSVYVVTIAGGSGCDVDVAAAMNVRERAASEALMQGCCCGRGW